MSQYFAIHPDNPQPRLVSQAAEIIRAGGVAAYPTDSGYGLGCQIANKNALERIREIRRIDDKHHLTLVCKDLSELANYSRVDNAAFRMIKNNTPGPYTFILEASKEVPRRLMHPKKKTIGLRIPDHPITQALLAELGEPLMSTSLILPGETEPMVEPWEIRDLLEHQLDLVIDGGYCGIESTTIVSLLDEVPEIIRKGSGDVSPFLF
ncbi:L-threonylcarbamoyladenylate synthase [Gynuella sunshinyii]|uniref:Putative translation factor (SUA5) n=1 Tax=Gynuella sunshinyii YC6258 TaxID=1445510 RepID=A0A0C5W1A1_9GAMM|nr:L-threonylcarbamoyladenylate synthase [Gynuella sunshinyii]AJQ96464.1 putative translation factor (SUA5) [Gynuella sunshinyii YC6258]